ncbi:MAG: hypothetical protein M3Y70_02390 [Pseudomonadota bacterium]|nr:hypothetical protein [Pseudomonadota bacterium]
MNPYAGMLFLEGHIVEPELARSLAGPVAADEEQNAPDPHRCEAGSFHQGAIASICGSASLSPFR